jgi:hypothetical protein
LTEQDEIEWKQDFKKSHPVLLNGTGMAQKSISLMLGKNYFHKSFYSKAPPPMRERKNFTYSNLESDSIIPRADPIKIFFR